MQARSDCTGDSAYGMGDNNRIIDESGSAQCLWQLDPGLHYAKSTTTTEL